MNNQECKVREVIIKNEYMLYPYSIKVNKCSGDCNDISDQYSGVCVLDVVKKITMKVFNLISWRNNQTKEIECHEFVNVNVD